MQFGNIDQFCTHLPEYLQFQCFEGNIKVDFLLFNLLRQGPGALATRLAGEPDLFEYDSF